jgi:filamentous hemagglutinin family protein
MKRTLLGSVTALMSIVWVNDRTIAQVLPDGTVGTTVNLNGTAFEINNGTRSGNNLFHSFSQFSIPTNGSAIFNNATDVQNIFSRITGSQLSNIDGILKTQGGANLFLMNPNGIIFGPNAKLELGGSFIGTTASSIKFSDAIEFNTLNTTPALLSVKVPIGLQMASNSGTIGVQGNGHTLVTLLPRSIPLPTQRDPLNTGLTLTSGKTLSLIGSNLQLTGGILTNEQGRIELGAVRSGTVGLVLQADQNLALNYSNVLTFGNLQLDRRSLIDVSGMTGGSIVLQGQNINLTTGSMILNQQFGSQTAGLTQLNAIESIQLKDGTAATITTIRSESLGSGQGSRTEINSQRLAIEASAQIEAASYLNGTVGVIQINATDQVQVSGASPFSPFVPSSIAHAVFSDSQHSQVNIKTRSLQVLDGGVISTSSLGLTRGSDLNIQASDILVSGFNPVIQLPSTIATTTFARGNGGDLMIEADRVLVKEIGILASSTLARGSAGQTTISASQWIEVNGPYSSIASFATRLSPIFQSAFGLPAIPSGSSNRLKLTTPQLRVIQGEVTVRSDGPGRAGNLEINTDSILMNTGGRITASTVSGNGGNIQLNVTDRLIMRNGSTIANDSFGIGDGGNTAINSPTLVGLENSDIKANAIQGSGGKIKITTQGIFGLQYRDRLTPDNDITASSEFGLNGNVQVNTIGINPANSLNTLPIDVVDSSRQIADRCGAAKTSSFVATGRGGMPQGPMKKHGSDRTWHDLRPQSASNSIVTPVLSTSSIQPIVEANAFEFDESGAISLIVPNPVSATRAATCGIAGSIGER